MKRLSVQIIREYGPFPGVKHIGGVTYDGKRVWFASVDRLNAFDPESGEMVLTLEFAASAGTAFDGQYLYQIVENRIEKLELDTHRVIASIPAPSDGSNSGLAWAEGALWVGQYSERKIHKVDPKTGDILRTLESNRFVTGVTWVDDELWHGTWEGDESELRRIDQNTGDVLEALDMPPGIHVSGLEFIGDDQFLCGGGNSNTVRRVRRPK